MKLLLAILILFAFLDGTLGIFLGTFGIAEYSNLVALALSAAFILPILTKRAD